MIITSWKVKGIFKADAQKVSDEIAEIGETVEPSEIVEKAKDESTELHKCFEWNNDIAAEKYRLHQARNLIGNLVVNIINLAGSGLGIGSGRTSGYGRYKVTDVKVG